MGIVEKLNVGIVGAAGRGASFRAAFEADPIARIHAVCDVRADLLGEAAQKLGASEMYSDYEDMLAQSELDAVVIGTPMQFHAPMVSRQCSFTGPILYSVLIRGTIPITCRPFSMSNIFSFRPPPKCFHQVEIHS